eukprot:361688-Chlamydomonas_euryale.AAC.1
MTSASVFHTYTCPPVSHARILLNERSNAHRAVLARGHDVRARLVDGAAQHRAIVARQRHLRLERDRVPDHDLAIVAARDDALRVPGKDRMTHEALVAKHAVLCVIQGVDEDEVGERDGVCGGAASGMAVCGRKGCCGRWETGQQMDVCEWRVVMVV